MNLQRLLKTDGNCRYYVIVPFVRVGHMIPVEVDIFGNQLVDICVRIVIYMGGNSRIAS